MRESADQPRKKPPLGVMPLRFWREQHPDPSLADLLARYVAVCAALERRRCAGMGPEVDWLIEAVGCYWAAWHCATEPLST